MPESFETTTVGEIVATDFRTASVFEQFGIDFCCGGRRLVAEACRAADVDPEIVRRALTALPPPVTVDDSTDMTRWPVDRLIHHIVSTHHAYIREVLPTITQHLAKLVHVHGARHHELSHISNSFDTLGGELQQHMLKEEHVLFPYIRELSAANGWRNACPFGTVQNPIRMMEREHQAAGDELQVIRELTGGYTPPTDGCTTYRVCFAELAHFERDLHRHVHLENNVLFPKAVALELLSWRRHAGCENEEAL